MTAQAGASNNDRVSSIELGKDREEPQRDTNTEVTNGVVYASFTA
jgi:hypothetical protein